MDRNATIMLPSGKSLEEPTLKLFKAARVVVDRPHPRAIRAEIRGFPGVGSAIFCRPDLIGKLVAEGVADFGIVGTDILDEEPDDRVMILHTLPYSRQGNGGTRVSFIAREGDVDSMWQVRVEFDEEKTGIPTVATEYPRQTRDFLARHGITFPLRSVRGSVEVLVLEKVCWYGVALVETGRTLEANGLIEIAVVNRANTVLIANRDRLEWEDGWRDKVGRRLANHLVETLIRAQRR